MSVQTDTALKAFFEAGDFPTASQFGDLIDSCFNLYPSATQFGTLTEGAGAGAEATNTATLQAAADWSCTNHKYVMVPAGTYEIDTTITFDSRLGTTGAWGAGFIGAGMAATKILQKSNNVPIVKIDNYDGDFTHSMRFSGLWLSYETLQTTSDTLSICIAWDRPDSDENSAFAASTVYRSSFTNIRVDRAYRGFAGYHDGSHANLTTFNNEFSWILSTELSGYTFYFLHDFSDGDNGGGGNSTYIRQVMAEGTQCQEGFLYAKQQRDLRVEGFEANHYTVTTNASAVIVLNNCSGIFSGKLEDCIVEPSDTNPTTLVLLTQSGVNFEDVGFNDCELRPAASRFASLVRVVSTVNNEIPNFGYVHTATDTENPNPPANPLDPQPGEYPGNFGVFHMDGSGLATYRTLNILDAGLAASLHSLPGNAANLKKIALEADDVDFTTVTASTSMTITGNDGLIQGTGGHSFRETFSTNTTFGDPAVAEVLWTYTLTDETQLTLRTYINSKQGSTDRRYASGWVAVIYRNGAGAAIEGSPEALFTEIDTGNACSSEIAVSGNDVQVKFTGVAATLHHIAGVIEGTVIA